MFDKLEDIERRWRQAGLRLYEPEVINNNALQIFVFVRKPGNFHGGFIILNAPSAQAGTVGFNMGKTGNYPLAVLKSFDLLFKQAYKLKAFLSCFI